MLIQHFLPFGHVLFLKKKTNLKRNILIEWKFSSKIVVQSRFKSRKLFLGQYLKILGIFYLNSHFSQMWLFQSTDYVYLCVNQRTHPICMTNQIQN